MEANTLNNGIEGPQLSDCYVMMNAGREVEACMAERDAGGEGSHR